MIWHGMMRLMQSIASNEIKSETTLPESTVIGSQQQRKGKERIAPCATSWEVTCKMHHRQDNASSYEQINNTILFLTEFYPKTMYYMIYLEQERTNGKQRKTWKIWFNSKHCWIYSKRKKEKTLHWDISAEVAQTLAGLSIWPPRARGASWAEPN